MCQNSVKYDDAAYRCVSPSATVQGKVIFQCCVYRWILANQYVPRHMYVACVHWMMEIFGVIYVWSRCDGYMMIECDRCYITIHFLPFQCFLMNIKPVYPNWGICWFIRIPQYNAEWLCMVKSIWEGVILCSVQSAWSCVNIFERRIPQQ